MVIEPYSPHRFSRQFGFIQAIPGYFSNKENYVPSSKRSVSPNQKMAKAKKNTVTKQNSNPKTNKMVRGSIGGTHGGVANEDHSYGDRNWRHLGRKSSTGTIGRNTTTFNDVESFLIGVPSTSQPLAIDVVPLPNDNFDLASRNEDMRLLDEFSDNEASVHGLSAFDLVIGCKSCLSVDPTSIVQTFSLPTAPTLSQVAPSVASTIDTRSMIPNARRSAASILDNHIKGLLSKTPIRKVPALGPKLQEFYDELSKLQVDYSPLQSQIEKYIQNTTTYISMKSTFAQGITLELQDQHLADVSQHANHALALENEGVEQVHLLKSDLGSLATKKAELLKALKYLDEQSQQLEITLSVVEAEVVQM
ncbi:unnamed protein product [Camellia sinensis]